MSNDKATGVVMLTTVDNPHSPLTEYEDWFAFDSAHGYHTPGLLARVAVVSDNLSEEDQVLGLRDAMREIVRVNVSGMHRLFIEENNNKE